MLALPACLGAWLSPSPAFASPPPSEGAPAPASVAAPTPQAPARLAQLLIRGDTLDPITLRQHLELRLADVQVVSAGEFPAPKPKVAADSGAPPLIAVVSFRRDGDRLDFALEFSDGRAYDRSIPQAGVSPERVVASELVSLVNAVLEGQVPADRESDAALFEPAPASMTQAPPPQDPIETPAPPASSWGPEFGLSFSGSATAGLAPGGDFERALYGGGGLAFAVAWPRGGTISLSLSGHARARPLGVGRLRVGLGGGYRWRPRDHFEWLNLAQVELGAWRIASDETLFARGSAVEQRPPLLGAALVTTPGWRTELGRRAALRVGPSLGLGFRASLGDPNGAPRITSAESGAVLARLGGFELELGLSIAFWFHARAGAQLATSGPAPASVPHSDSGSDSDSD